MSKLESLNLYLSERLTAAAVEILGAVEKVLAEYQEEISRSKEENDWLRGQLRSTPERKQYSQAVSLLVSKEEVPPEQQHCEQELYPSLRHEEPGSTRIKEELRTSQEQQFIGLEGNNIELLFSSPCVKSEQDQVAFSQSSAVVSDQVHSPPLDPEAQCSKLCTSSTKSHCCYDCGKIFALKTDLQRHVTVARERPIECPYNSTWKLKALVPMSQVGKPCRVCRKTFNSNEHLSQHMRIHTWERPFSCKDCGKCFHSKGLLNVHIQTHKGEKRFGCGYCAKRFYQKGNLTQHLRTHTGEKPFSCGECGNKFNRRTHLNRHILTHTGEKKHGCSVCGRRFAENADLLKHMDKVHK
ncbi:zinc finger protein 436-like isoform X2 [Esox lucius]|uniref:zinc finger protein 436-like isoform X2 n=1 Tax=Esox lucius TaxID=8010 RepID=UPI000576A9A1|nr:zinc finger protein 436-like isoform X2 [Esox lucius]